MIEDHITALDLHNLEKAKEEAEKNGQDEGDATVDQEQVIVLDRIRFIPPQMACSFRDFGNTDRSQNNPVFHAFRSKIVQHLRQFFEDNSVPYNAFPAVKPDEMVWFALFDC